MKIVIVPIEPLETRYTGEWYRHLPKQLQSFGGQNVEVIQIDVEAISTTPTDGAFLNFADTNVYKSKQFLELCKLLPSLGKGDKVLFTDAWNPTAIQLRYMKDLMQGEYEIHGMWHAGSYDEHDFLGRAFDKSWSYDFERALFNAFDMNYFATKFHESLFFNVLQPRQATKDFWDVSKRHLAPIKRSKIVGWPMEYLRYRLSPSKSKRDLIVFPHRVSKEKQPHIFRLMAEALPQFEFVICQDKQLTKAEYHAVLNDAKIVFSASLQETLGIGMFEGMLCGAIPVMPNRLSYQEMFKDSPGAVLYPPEWASAETGVRLSELISLIEITMRDYDKYAANLGQNKVFQFFDGEELYKSLLS